MILGADTRATEGPIVADKNCEKIHYMAPNIYCCGAGTAADTEAVTGMSSLTLRNHNLIDIIMWCSTEFDALVILVYVSLFRYGQLTAAAASLPDWPRLSGYHCFDPSQKTPFQVILFLSSTISSINTELKRKIGDFKHSLHPAIKVMSQLLSSLVELISQGLICTL